MSPSQEILNSIEERLRQLAQEIARLETARSELQTQAPLSSQKSKPSPRSKSSPRSVKKTDRARRSRTAAAIAAVPEISEEEWLERRAAELAAQSRQAAAA